MILSVNEAEQLRYKIEIQIFQKKQFLRREEDQKYEYVIDIRNCDRQEMSKNDIAAYDEQSPDATTKNKNDKASNYFPSSALSDNSQYVNEKPAKDNERVETAETKDRITIEEELEQSIDNEYEFAGAEFEANVTPSESRTTDDYDVDSMTSDMSDLDAAHEEGRLTTTQALGLAWALDNLRNRMHVINLLTSNNGDETSDPEAVDSRTNDSNRRALVKTMLERTAEELRLSDTYDTLQNVNKSMFDKRKLMKKHSTNRDAVKVLRDELERQQNLYEKKKWRIEMKMEDLPKKYEQIKEHLVIQNELLLAWEEARKITNKELLEEEERCIKAKLQATEENLILEKRGIEEARYIFAKTMARVNQSIEMWEKKYNGDVGEIDSNILNLEKEEEDWDNAYEKLQETEDNYLKLISELEDRKHLREEKIRMATKIQAFWRGTMVRKFLGQYAKLKDLFKKKSKKKTKKKKKITNTK